MDKTDSPGVIAPPPILYGLAFMLGWGIQAMMPLALVSSSMIRWGLGVPLLLTSSGFVCWALAAMRAAKTSVNPYKASSALVTSGPFRFSRNPIYLALTGLYLCAVLWANSIWPLLMLIPLLWLMHRGVILREERYLSGKFGEAYTIHSDINLLREPAPGSRGARRPHVLVCTLQRLCSGLPQCRPARYDFCRYV